MKNRDKVQDLDFEIKFYENILKTRPNFTEVLIALGDAYTKNKLYEEGLAIDERLSRLKPEDPIVFYNLACSYSLTERIDFSLRALKRAMRLGYDDFNYMNKDPDLENLRKDERYQILVKRTAKSKNFK